MLTLAVPYSDKDEVKTLGAKWSVDNKCWVVPTGKGWAKFTKWLSPEKIEQLKAEKQLAKKRRVTKLQNGAKLMDMLNPFPDDEL